MADFNFENFSYDSSDEDEIPQKKKYRSEINRLVNQSVQLQVRNKLSNRAHSNVLKFVNDVNSSLKIPNSLNAIKKCTETNFEYKILLECQNCFEINKEIPNCLCCGSPMKKDSKKNNFLVHMPLKQQIQQLLDKHFEQIIAYLNREHIEGVMSDVDDSLIYKKINSKYVEIENVFSLFFSINADGAAIFNCSKGSMWPVQLYANFLPPRIRYSSENIILSTVYYGKKKPDMFRLLHTLAKEFDDLGQNLITVFKKQVFWNFRPLLLFCITDLPARAQIQAMKGPTGKFGCPYCYHEGVPTKNLAERKTIRYVQSKEMKLRTHEETVKITQQLNGNKKLDSIKGIKGINAMILFKNIDFIHSFPIDIMHGVFLGIVNDTVQIWLGKKQIPKPAYKDYKIKSVLLRKRLEQRILKLKPTVEIHRKPRSIFEIGNFKASELMYFLWYYLRYSLVGILPNRVIKNFEKLSVSTYILCKENICESEKKKACEMLREFAIEYEQIYGPGAITMNLHLLNHYESMIDNCGPASANWMFGFENNIRHLKNFVSGTTDVLNQIARKYTISKSGENKTFCGEKNVVPSRVILYHKKTVPIKPEHRLILESSKRIENDQTEQQIWARARLNGQIYTSTHAVITKSIDFFVRTTNNKIGKIEFFFGDPFKPQVLLQLYEEKFLNFHWTEIQQQNVYALFSYDEIQEKVMYFNTNNIEYITKEPNTYGRGMMIPYLFSYFI